MDGKDKLAALGIGALGGGIVAFLGWAAFSSQVDRQVDATVRTAVDEQVQVRLTSAGLTPAVVANLRTTIENLDRAGLFTALAQGTALPSSGTRGRR